MVHQTMAIRMTKASKASSNNNVMGFLSRQFGQRFGQQAAQHSLGAALLGLAALGIVGSLGGCAHTPAPESPRAAEVSADAGARSPSASLLRAKSRWVAVDWRELPGLEQDAIEQAWPAWLRSCERPSTDWKALCPALRQLAQAPQAQRRAWLREHLQPYRVEALSGEREGLLTAYYEPVLEGRRQPQGRFVVPVHAAPATLAARKPWYTRQEIDTLPAARAALRGRELLYLADPVEAMVLHIQGSGLARVTEPDGRVRTVRLAFAATNEQPYKSIGRWLLDQGLARDVSWPGIQAWIARNPGRTQELLWQNPRYVFFREEALPAGEVPGPKGAQGVPLTAGRSIAVDPGSIPYGTPVWLASAGPQGTLERLVLAQDTGSAIVGAVRADYYAGSGAEAGEWAGRLKQPLRLWVLWPR